MTTNSKEMVRTIQIQQGAKIVLCNYLDDKRTVAPLPKTVPWGDDEEDLGGAGYSFINATGIPLACGDIVVVQSVDSLALVRVANPDQLPTQCSVALGQLKHVIAKVDMNLFGRILSAENNAVQQLAMSEVTERLDKYREQIGGKTMDSLTRLLAPMSDVDEEVVD